ncbi:dipeptidase [Salinicoccus albus]|uniref:dipeptidase n=1 Tax=Salinicoccus albus TaxID=418756 RepID=UPI00037AB999|nr:dipeptidase [Salinicoccus albus]
MEIIDTHCDALLKLQEDYRKSFCFSNDHSLMSYKDSKELDTNADKLRQGNVRVQFFAIFIPQAVPDSEKWQHALEQADRFYSEVLAQENFVHIRHFKEIEDLKAEEVGAVLTLEGADAFGNDIMKLRTLFRLGVLSLGLVWNNANLVADGAGENRGTGLSNFGWDVIDCCNEYGVLIDVSHLNVEGFNDVIGRADRVIATHSNARGIYDHPRNLYDDQIKQLINNNGMINIVFNPPFVKEGSVEIKDLFPHIDRIVELGGEENIGLGSDFDGISEYIKDLEDAGKYSNLTVKLTERYGSGFTKRMAYDNFIRRFC